MLWMNKMRSMLVHITPNFYTYLLSLPLRIVFFFFFFCTISPFFFTFVFLFINTLPFIDCTILPIVPPLLRGREDHRIVFNEAGDRSNGCYKREITSYSCAEKCEHFSLAREMLLNPNGPTDTRTLLCFRDTPRHSFTCGPMQLSEHLAAVWGPELAAKTTWTLAYRFPSESTVTVNCVASTYSYSDVNPLTAFWCAMWSALHNEVRANLNDMLFRELEQSIPPAVRSNQQTILLICKFFFGEENSFNGDLVVVRGVDGSPSTTVVRLCLLNSVEEDYTVTVAMAYGTNEEEAMDVALRRLATVGFHDFVNRIAQAHESNLDISIISFANEMMERFRNNNRCAE
ncbi:hypothetical protein STCU_11188 [Strigomonas culicis]|uniref:Uncharacterized protein n=1 Tax=Strigomonas culicis TaxID=28005 RepID=S9TEN4_9TRYP|nr:hypothetical protein STCU_11188 [Strigomonas culicis]|eukprot:EPY16507.1 hypothetical protein STCU_11188 [Strigomonas culicis]